MKKNPKLILIIFCFIIMLTTNKIYADANILVFHRFGDQRYPSTNISQQRLTEIFDFFKENEYKVVSLNRIINYIENSKEIPDKTIAITIDDGYKSFYENGLELFKEYNYPFTIFINTKAINQHYGDFLTWDQLKEISKYGSIGSHSYVHKHLTLLTLADLERDIEKSISDIKENLGVRPKYFSYPYGEYNSKVKAKLKEMNFKAVFNQNIGGVAKNSDYFNIHRIAITDDSVIEHKLKYKYLKAKWLDEEDMVTDNRLIKVQIETDKDIKQAELYISGYGWRRVNLQDGILDLDLNLKLKYSRNRIFLKTYKDEITSKMIVIEDYLR